MAAAAAATDDDALILLLETVSKQAAQIKRLEAIVIGGDRHAPLSARQLSQARPAAACDLAVLQAKIAALEQAAEEQAGSAAAVEQRLQQLEAHSEALLHHNQQLQLQLGAPPSSSYLSSSSPQRLLRAHPRLGGLTPGTAAAAAAAAYNACAAGGSHQASVSARMQQLEARVESMTAAAISADDKLQAAVAAVQALDKKLGKQLCHVRADVQQALAVTAASTKAELEDAAAARERQAAHHMQQQLNELSASFNARLAESQRGILSSLEEQDRRVAAAHEAAGQRVATLRSQVDRLEEEKADVSLVSSYTGQVADTFEQLAATVADSTQASISQLLSNHAQLLSNQTELRGVLAGLSSGKADASALEQHHQQLLGELQRGMAAAHAAVAEGVESARAAAEAAAAGPVDALRLQLAEAQGGLAALQQQALGLEAAAGSAGHEQQQQSLQLQQLSDGQHILQQQLRALATHVDPAAAAQLAAAAAGDAAALTFEPLGQVQDLLASPGSEGLGCEPTTWLTGSLGGCYMQQLGGSSSGGGGGGSSSGGGARAHAAAATRPSGHAAANDAPGFGGLHSETSECVLAAFAAATQQQQHAAGTVGAGRQSAVLRHLPVAVRLLRLESAVRELSGSMASKAAGGELHALHEQQQLLARRLDACLESSSGSTRQLEQQLASLVQHVQALAESDPEAAARSTAVAASLAAVQPLQRQLAELEATLRQELQQHVAASAQQQDGQFAALRAELQQHVQQAASDAVKQQQPAAAAGKAAVAASRVAALDARVKALAADVAGSQQRAAEAAQLQEAQAKAMLQSQSEAHATALARLQASLREQGVVVDNLAAAVAQAPDRAAMQESVSKAGGALQQQLARHTQQAEERWEVWLKEMLKAVQKQLRAAEARAVEAALRRMQAAGAAAAASGSRQGGPVQPAAAAAAASGPAAAKEESKAAGAAWWKAQPMPPPQQQQRTPGRPCAPPLDAAPAAATAAARPPGRAAARAAVSSGVPPKAPAPPCSAAQQQQQETGCREELEQLAELQQQVAACLNGGGDDGSGGGIEQRAQQHAEQSLLQQLLQPEASEFDEA